MPTPDSPPPVDAQPRRDLRLTLLGVAGVLSAALIVTATLIGGWLRDDFSHVAHTISELYETGAPNAGALMVLFTAYHALVIPLAIGLHLGLPGGRRGWLGPALLAMAGLLGIPLGAYARCDPGCFGATTFRGQLHGVLVLVTVPLIFAAMIATWWRARRHPAWRRYARYTLATAGVGIAFGAGMAPFVQGPYAGLLERIAVGILLQWYVVTGVRLVREARRPGGRSGAGADHEAAWAVVPFRPERNATLDTLRWARRRHGVPILVEVDVTAARQAIREARQRTGKPLGFTAWVVCCVARAAAEHPRVHALRRGRRRMVVFHEVDVAVLVERAVAGDAGGEARETLPMPCVVRQAHRKGPWQIDEEIRSARNAPVADGAASIERGPAARLQRLFFRLPTWLRDLLFWRWLVRSPLRFRKTMGTVVVTATGMAAPGVLAWGVPLALHPLAVGIGGIAERSTAAGRAEILALTVVFDHSVTDGAPVGRFIRRLHQLLSHPDDLALPADEARARPPDESPARPAAVTTTPARG